MALLVLTQAPLGIAHPQTRGRENGYLRDDCRLAAHVLQTGTPHTRHFWALEAIRSCDPDLAVPALVHSWNTASGDSVRLMALFRSGRRFRDGRLYRAARSVAIAPERPQVVRIAALATLAAQVDPRIAMDLGLLQPIRGLKGRWQSVWFGDNHGYAIPGEVPLPVDVRADVKRIAEGIASTTPRDALADTASRLLRFLHVEDGT